MDRKRVGIIAVATIVIIAAGAYAVFMGVGPVPGGNGDGNVSSYPSSDEGSTYNASGDGGMASEPPFTFTVNEITQCGQTCRNVTVTIHNQQSTAAKNVTVYSRIYAGNNTNPDNRVWSGNKQVGRLQANSSYTGTQTVRLSYSEGYAVQQKDGWITILTTVESDGQTVTFKMRRDVA